MTEKGLTINFTPGNLPMPHLNPVILPSAGILIKQAGNTQHLGRSRPGCFRHPGVESFMTTTDIARVAHETNRAYCESIGDTSQVPWNDAPEWQKVSAMAGVHFRIKNPDATPEAMHESWRAQKFNEGWTHGPVKDPQNKVHPCMVDYKNLPREQQAKDALFSAVVGALVPHLP
jgi:hypothetical protein